MPARYSLPPRGLAGPVPVENLDAARSGWFDPVTADELVSDSSSGLEPHDFIDKPYTISPLVGPSVRRSRTPISLGAMRWTRRPHVVLATVFGFRLRKPCAT